ncbi:MAG: hypothetical protein ACRD4R_00810 [Candidatus Acidiferrales bacterium]
MADWRQIQARIRKAKSGRDPSAKLSELYQRTRDAMVAWELGAIEEKAERQDEATKWYTIAAQRFRRADWKKKAQEALTRLGAPLPPEQSQPAMAPQEAPQEEAHLSEEHTHQELEHERAVSEVPVEGPDYESQTRFFGSTDLDQRHEDRLSTGTGEITPTDVQPAGSTKQPASSSGEEAGGRKRRRGRRGGRGRRRKGAGAPGLPSQAFAPLPQAREEQAGEHAEIEAERAGFEPPTHPPGAHEEIRREPARQVREAAPAPQLPSERIAHGRAGDPALASQMNHLESLMRRLLGGALHRLSEAEDAPAGPGVFLLSDSDQVTSYYVESCQTLRVGIANLVRGRGGKGRPGARGFADIDLKEKLAEHLGIGEAKVGPYLKEHCVVRWIQLDDEAPQLAHFAIAVLRTPLNFG